MVNQEDLPEEVLEHILASAYSWKLDYIRTLSPAKFKAHVGICMVRQRLEKVQEQKRAIQSAGAKPKGKVK